MPSTPPHEGRSPSGRPSAARGRFAGLSPEERRTERKRLLVEAGLQCFGTDGFHAVGVRRVCAEAGLSERYFYESFANLEALFLAVYGHAVEHIRQTLRGAIDAAAVSATPNALIEDGLRAYLGLLKSDPRLVRIGLIDVNAIGSEMGTHSLSMNRSFTELIVPTILAACPDIEARGYDAQLVAEGLLGSTLFLVTQWATDGFSTPLETVLTHCAIFYRALLRSLEQDAP